MKQSRRVWITRSAEGNRAWYPKVQAAGYGTRGV